MVSPSAFGESGARTSVVALADLNDLQIELDISQTDFARLKMNQRAEIIPEAFPSLKYSGFIAEIDEAIGIDARAAGGLELEITESVIMEDVRHSIAVLQSIRAMGVSIAIDDFGTGFSSLSYLAKLPVDTLKIDRSFVVDMTSGPQGLALVSTIITLAHSLKLNVVAEGVETEEQSHLLRLLSCDEMQGFLFSKPVPSEIFETRFLAPVIVRDPLRGT